MVKISNLNVYANDRAGVRAAAAGLDEALRRRGYRV